MIELTFCLASCFPSLFTIYHSCYIIIVLHTSGVSFLFFSFGVGACFAFPWIPFLASVFGLGLVKNESISFLYFLFFLHTTSFVVIQKSPKAEGGSPVRGSSFYLSSQAAIQSLNCSATLDT
jgi:hypothetical protein